VVWVRKHYAPDLPYQWIRWPSWAWWRWMQMNPDDESIAYRELRDREWGEGTTGWDDVDWERKAA